MKFFRALYRLGVSLRTCSGYKWRSSCSSINNNLRASWRADLSTFTKKNLHDPAEQVEQLLSDLDTLSVEQRKDAYARALNSAQQGSSKGKLLVGCLLRCGIGTERNEKKALEVLEPLAESGDAYASFLCGDILEQMYEETLSATHVAEQSAQISDMKAYLDEKYSESRTFLEKAIRYYEKSVENGNDESLVALGNAWLKMQHPEKAKEAYMKAVEKGITSALLCLGNLYFQGFVGKFSSVSPDGLKASKYLTASAEEGNTEAKYLLGELYSSGLEPIEPDEASAIRYLESAAEDNHSEACYLLSKILLDKEELDPGTVDMEKILKYLLVAAEENHSGACYFLADLYYKAGGLENYQQALSLFERSGVSGMPSGFYMAAMMHLYGVGTQKDAKMGIELLNRAAEMGSIEALEKLGELYRFGEFGLEKSEEKAVMFQKAASSLKEREVTQPLETSPLWSKRVPANKGIYPKLLETKTDKRNLPK